MYQDIWIKGKLYQKGERECESRYNIIKLFCENIKKPFSVLDIGANMCYFDFRLIEDFNCNIMAYEYNNYDIRQKYIKMNNYSNLMLINKKLNLNDMKILSVTCHFDLILALSIIHHLQGSIKEWIKYMKKISNNIIIEMALNDSKRVKNCIEYELPENKLLLGYGKSHLDENIKRPIYLIKGENNE